MEENNKQLLIRDICARLPYGVYVKFEQYNEPLCLSVKDALAIYNGGKIINDIQYLYLRPMSSMTEEELKMFKQLQVEADEAGTFEGDMLLYDWLNKNHFDYKLLIFQGLALEAPEGMYKIE